MCQFYIFSFLLIITATDVYCFKSSCLNAATSPNENLTIVQCTEEAVTIEWNAVNDLQYIAFEYSCIHPTNSRLSVLNHSFPFWNDGQFGSTKITPLSGALCLFSACYLDQDNTRHFIAPTSCVASSSTEGLGSAATSLNVALTDTTSYITATSPTVDLSAPTALRGERALPYQRQHEAHTPFLVIAAATLIVVALVAAVTATILIVQVKRHFWRTASNSRTSVKAVDKKNSFLTLLRSFDDQCGVNEVQSTRSISIEV